MLPQSAGVRGPNEVLKSCWLPSMTGDANCTWATTKKNCMPRGWPKSRTSKTRAPRALPSHS
eukprot:14534167-Alexandrium_andersonii.AAC.1